MTLVAGAWEIGFMRIGMASLAITKIHIRKLLNALTVYVGGYMTGFTIDFGMLSSQFKIGLIMIEIRNGKKTFHAMTLKAIIRKGTFMKIGVAR